MVSSGGGSHRCQWLAARGQRCSSLRRVRRRSTALAVLCFCLALAAAYLDPDSSRPLADSESAPCGVTKWTVPHATMRLETSPVESEMAQRKCADSEVTVTVDEPPGCRPGRRVQPPSPWHRGLGCSAALAGIGRLRKARLNI